MYLNYQCFTVPKDLNYPESIEDRYCYNKNNNRFAVSDGASESFDSANWAKTLVNCFSNNKFPIDDNFIKNTNKQYEENIDKENMSWSQINAFERGSFATFIGVTFYPNNTIDRKSTRGTAEIFYLGDSEVFILSGRNNCIDRFPYSSPQEFKQRPLLFSTNPVHNNFFTKDFIKNHTKNINLIENKTILIMTDALACWAMEKSQYDKYFWDNLLNIKTEKELQSLVEVERINKQIKIDDVTLAILSLGVE